MWFIWEAHRHIFSTESLQMVSPCVYHYGKLQVLSTKKRTFHSQFVISGPKKKIAFIANTTISPLAKICYQGLEKTTTRERAQKGFCVSPRLFPATVSWHVFDIAECSDDSSKMSSRLKMQHICMIWHHHCCTEQWPLYASMYKCTIDILNARCCWCTFLFMVD